MAWPTPHLEKLNATLANEKLPSADKPRMEGAIDRYGQWIADLNAVTGTPQERVRMLVSLLNEYRLHLDVEIVFDSSQDFLRLYAEGFTLSLNDRRIVMLGHLLTLLRAPDDFESIARHIDDDIHALAPVSQSAATEAAF